MFTLVVWFVASGGGGANEFDLARVFQRALQLHQASEYADALEAYREVLTRGEELTPKALTMACTNAGALELSVGGDVSAAGELLARASRTSPTSAAAWANECVFWAPRDAGRARETCSRALDLDPSHEAAAATLAELAVDDGRVVATATSAREDRPLAPTDIEARLLSSGVAFERLFDERPPFAWRLGSVLSREACDALVAHGNRVGWEPSKTTGDSHWRFSESVSIPWEAPAAAPLLAAAAAGDESAFKRASETPQLVRYPPGGFFDTHSDAATSFYYRNREATMLFYLDDAPCATHFPFARANVPRFDLAAALRRLDEFNSTGLSVFPRAGDALLFVNVDLETRTRPDALALHARSRRPLGAQHNIYLHPAGRASVPRRQQARRQRLVSLRLLMRRRFGVSRLDA